MTGTVFRPVRGFYFLALTPRSLGPLKSGAIVFRCSAAWDAKNANQRMIISGGRTTTTGGAGTKTTA
jgi:hypothetical protein